MLESIRRFFSAFRKTIAFTFSSVGLVTSIFWFKEDGGFEPFVSTTVFLAAVVGSLAIPRRIADLSGKWEYEVTGANNEFSHKGTCTIAQRGRYVWIHGTRRFTCTRQQSCKPVNITWASEWAEICSDNFLRFDYHIAIPQTKTQASVIKAICRICLDDALSGKVAGNYYMLPPFDESIRNCPWGTIQFRRLGPTEEMEPPPRVIENPDED